MADPERFSNTALPTDKAVVVIGAGTMGSGIAEVAATAGHRVYLRDTSEAALERGMQQIRGSLGKRVERGRLDAAQRDAILARLQPVNAEASLSGVGFVIEVIVENLEVKVAVLRQIESEVEPDTIIATNTSSLSVTAIAGRLARPDRVVGMHFFNPATILPLVEVIGGAATATEVTQTIVATAKAWGKVPVVCRSTPGFIVNRVARPYYGEALRLLQEQAATPATLDAVMRDCGGFKMGPCELMDLIGHDVNFAVTKSVYEGFFDDPRYKPSLVQKDLVDAGWLGRKSGRGFFDYRAGAAAAKADEGASRGRVPSVLRIEGDLGPAAALGELLLRQDETTVERGAGSGLLRVDGFAVALSDGRTATERSLALGESVVLFDLALDYGGCARIALAAAAQARDAHLASAIGLFALLGKKVSVLADVPGLAVTRTVAMLVNEAADAVHQGIASADDVDAAMQKGVNYPLGPMAWGRQIGFAHVATVLRHLAQAYGEDRYRTSLWLQRAVHAGRSRWECGMAELVRAEKQGRVGIVTIARPERRNALNLQVKREIVSHLQALAQDADAAVIVLTGEGGYFVAGTDIAEMAEMRPTDHVLLATDQVFHVVRQSPKPVIAAVEGFALGGGCELALACDLIVAADDAKFGQPEIRVGIMPGAGGTQRLLRSAGRYKTLLWSLTGDMIPAREAFAANLVSALVPKGEALARSVQIAEQIATMPPLAVQAVREAVRLGADAPLETALSLERRLFERLFDSQDQKEGMRAFLEKRAPRYEGR